MSEEEEVVEEEEFDQEAQERGAWAARGWGLEEEPEIDPELMTEIEELVRAQMVDPEQDIVWHARGELG